MCISEVEFDPDQQPAWRELQKRTEILKALGFQDLDGF